MIYDSAYGNTEKVARAIHDRLGTRGETRIVRLDEATNALADQLDLLVVGGPTQRHGTSPSMRAFLHHIPRRSLRGTTAAAFDTRYDMNPRVPGSAARRIAQALRRAGCNIPTEPQSFFITMDQPPPKQKRRHEMEELAPGE
ncbi:MAG: flavodoxin family protein, partial [Deinococcales bacterium]